MMYFGIPLRSKHSSKNWNVVSEMFNNTLRSIYNQTNSNFKIIVACHDVPDINFSIDSRVEFHQVEIPVPNNLNEQMKDKGYKVHLIGKIIHDYGGGYTMIVDADDLISNRICEFVHKNYGKTDGWYVKTGYMYYHDSKKLSIAPKFPSGSNFICFYNQSDLPSTLENAYIESQQSSHYIITKSHNIEIKLKASENVGKKIRPLPFKGAIYILGTGDNHSTLNGRRSKLRSIIDFFLRVPISSKIKNEFSL